jgi:hypothetical protein
MKVALNLPRLRWRREPQSLVAHCMIVLLSAIAAAQILKSPLTTTAEVPKVVLNERQQVKATAPARAKHRQSQEQQVRPENYDLQRYPVTSEHEAHWRNLLWTTTVVQPQESFVVAALDQILAMMTRSGLSESQMRTIDSATKVGTQLYLSQPERYARLGDRFADAIQRSPDPEWVAVSLAGLAAAGLPPAQQQALVATVQQRFPDWAGNAFLQTTIRDRIEALASRPTPPLRDLLKWSIAPNQLHLYVLCQPDRHVLCRTVLKDRTGKFVRTPAGELWSIPLLLRSIHNLSWNFVRGHTPQGIYRIEGVVPQPDDEYFRAYGQFPLVNLYLPFEPGAREFLPGRPGRFNGSLAAYQALLPSSWRSHWPIQQSYWAGKLGRSEFRIHGTGDAPDFFSGKESNPDSFNWNPSLGCLSAIELYNEKGQVIEADMPKLLQSLTAIAGQAFTGYLVVAEVPSEPTGEPIALPQIEAAIAGEPLAQSPPLPKTPLAKAPLSRLPIAY